MGVLLAEWAHDLSETEELPADQIPGLVCQVAALQSILAARLVRALQTADETRAEGTDRLLTVPQAAERLACTADWLYRHHPRLSFAVRNGRQLRFSADGLDRYIRQRAGRETTSLPRQTEP